jgi:hypothetical protein
MEGHFSQQAVKNGKNNSLGLSSPESEILDSLHLVTHVWVRAFEVLVLLQ